ncbi:hypothetical protein GCM10027259_15390 [Micromonospora palomenae]
MGRISEFAGDTPVGDPQKRPHGARAALRTVITYGGWDASVECLPGRHEG